jgi:WD40 repeat protein
MIRSFALSLTVLALACVQAQVVLEPAERTIKCAKAEVTCLAVAPKGDRILVGTDKGAELMDITTGKRLQVFAFNQDESTAVYHCAFNDNGEYVVLIGGTGKREVWDVKDGKQQKVLNTHTWIPDATRVRQMGLTMKNSHFDRFYQQSEAKQGEVTAKADKNGVVVFTNAEGATLQTLKFPENKDQHHRAPCLFTDDRFITGTDDGRVLIYALAAR